MGALRAKSEPEITNENSLALHSFYAMSNGMRPSCIDIAATCLPQSTESCKHER